MGNKKIGIAMTVCLIMMMGIIGIIGLHTRSEAKASTLPAPSKVRARSYRQEHIRLIWNKVKGATGYQIYQYKAKEKKYVKVTSVGGDATSWKGGKTKKKQTYKVRAFRKTAKKKVFSAFSYEVSAIPYKKMARKVNAGKVKINRYRISLSSWQGGQVTAKERVSRYAGNKKAKVYDTKLRWHSTNEKVAKVDQEGNITAQGKTGTCKVYARAHNGNCDWLWVKVTNYARPDEFEGVDDMQEDMEKLIRQHAADLMDIAEFFEKNKANHADQNQVMMFRLDSGRNRVEAEEISGLIDYQGVEKVLYRVLDSYPGMMEIHVNNGGIHFKLKGYLSEYVDLIFLFKDAVWNDEEGIRQTGDYFETALRWIYHFSRLMEM